MGLVAIPLWPPAQAAPGCSSLPWYHLGDVPVKWIEVRMGLTIFLVLCVCISLITSQVGPANAAQLLLWKKRERLNVRFVSLLLISRRGLP